MPYDNVPRDLWSDMDECVESVQSDQDISKDRAIAICYDSIVTDKSKSLDDRIAEMIYDYLSSK